MSTEHACPICDSHDVSAFFKVAQMPVHVGLQWPSREAARRCPKGDIVLQFCRTCGHIYNSAFDPDCMEYTEAYDNSLHFSPRFQEYSQAVASHLIDRYDLHERSVIDIGCGKGEFLTMLARLGNNRAIGFDPSYEPDRHALEEEALNGNDHDGNTLDVTSRVTVIQDFYSEKYAEYGADLICSRYVFEHVPHPLDFLQTVRQTVEANPDTVVYFEVPNVFLILRNLSVWDIIYEHCSYFSPSSLARAFDRCGFEVRDLYEGYEGQHLGIEAVPHNGTSAASEAAWGDPKAMEPYIHAFQQRFQHAREQWSQHLTLAQTTGQRVVLWGGGAKAIGFLNMLKVDPEVVEYVVDVNPHKHGAFMGGTGQEIVPPAFLKGYQPDVVIAMNPIYREEIKSMMNDLGVTAKYLEAS